MKRLARWLSIALSLLLLVSLLAACTNSIGIRAPQGSNQPAQPALNTNNNANIQADPQADAIEQSLTDLEQQLQSTDTLDDLK